MHAGQGQVPFAEYVARVLLHLLAIATVGGVTWAVAQLVPAVTAMRDGEGAVEDDSR